ncbi:hypothetical protein Ancab_033197 [Ancistrocladus abbreviatus]
MVSGSTSGSYELRSRTVEKFPLSELRARRLAEWRKRGKVDKWAAPTEEERKENWEDPVKGYAEQCLMLATQAVKHLNKTSRSKGGLQYELVEALASNPFMTCKFNYHCNFRAKPKGAPDNETKLFFAEFSAKEVSCCCISDSGDPPSSVGACTFCSWIPELLHPLDGFLNEDDVTKVVSLNL